MRSVSLALALVAAIVVWFAPGRRRLPLLPLFGVWLGAAALSLVTTRDLAASLDAIEGEVLRSFVVFFIFYTLSQRLSAHRIWVAATALGFSVLSVMAIVSFHRHGDWVYYYVPPLGDFATSAVTLLPLLAGYAVLAARDRPVALFAGFACAVTLLAGYLTHSRALWLALIGGLFLAVAIRARHLRFARRPAVLVALVGAAALGLAALASSDRERALTDTHDRPSIYAAVVKKILANPLTGTGYGHETDKPWYQQALPGTNVFHSHNVALSYVDQMGPLGLAAVLMIFGAPALVFSRALRSGGDATIPAVCGLALLGCVFVKNNFDYFFWKQNLWLFFAHLGMYLGAIDHHATRDESRVQASAT